jgi:hypothetical protein
MEKLKTEFVSQAEFARRMGIHRSQVTRAIQRGRISLDKKTNKINYLKSKEEWGSNRVDSLASQGIANNTRVRLPIKPNISDIAKPPQFPKDINFNDLVNNDVEDDDTVPTSELGKPPKKNTIAWQDYRIKKAKASQEESKEKIYSGELIPKKDMIGVITATLTGIKMGVLALPSRTVLDILGIVKGVVINKGIELNEGEWAEFQTEIKNIMETETHTILTDIKNKNAELDKEAENIAKKYRTKK